MENQQIREEMTKVQAELQQALNEMIDTVGKKLSPKDRKEIEKEFNDINDVLERLKTGKVWVALFGKTSVGKSAIANSLIGDNVAEVGVEHDKTTVATAYEKEHWKIVDVPGFMGKKVNEDIAIEEAKKAHGHIFVIDGEPYEDEIELFNLVHERLPDTPKIVFVNKWDRIQENTPKKEQEIIRSRIEKKMGIFVKSQEDIVYGSAMLYDRKRDDMIQQELPKLLDRMYEGAGTLAQVMNILDPAERAADLNENINNKIFDIRVKLARKVIAAFSLASAFTELIPFSTLIAHPGILTSMVFAICIIMGKKQDMKKVLQITKNLLQTCAKTIGITFTATVAAVFLVDIVSTALTPVFGIGALLGLAADVLGVGYFNYQRTATLGEVTIDYIRNDFSWGADGQAAVIKQCQKRVKDLYISLKPSHASGKLSVS
ncbi:small GTP-binding protein [Tolypothrix sp. NIES-4075]|uniref:GTPase n=1 Tax=Tolypothrix sp. NIES-4075 TaxID=2005459 RepID=UPI000B5CB533|nr:GTPase [Tolypothrix sp. NIES-4075]GAX43617.1 small GTP-binding protein [Tolypothrix sp. NIES-4075]